MRKWRLPAASLSPLAGIGIVAVLVVLVWAVGRPPSSHGHARTPAPPSPLVAEVNVAATAASIPVPRSFLGLSTEYWTLPIWERNLRTLERVLALLHVPGDAPLVLRIGGDSADHSMWAPARHDAPEWAFELTPGWLAQVRDLVARTGARLILDLNLVTATPTIAAQWAGAAASALPARTILGFEIGNEADIYSRAGWLSVFKKVPDARAILPAQITAAGYVHDFEAYARALARVAPGVPLLGPALANPRVHVDWIAALLRAAHPGLRELTVHRYPYSDCAFPDTPAYPTIARVLSADASTGLASALAPAIALAHRAGLPLRLTELNSVTCGGRPGVSNTFATALWAPDTLFELMRSGVSAVDVHVRDHTVNAAFRVTDRGLLPQPLFYGLLMFTRTLGPGARLVDARVNFRQPAELKAWVVRVSHDVLHVLLIDKGPNNASVTLRLPSSAPATLQRLVAPSVTSRSGETLSGQWLNAAGLWQGTPVAEAVVPRAGVYRVALARMSAALLSVAVDGPARRPPLVALAAYRRPPLVALDAYSHR